MQSTSTIYNFLLPYTIYFDVLPASTILYKNFELFQLPSILYNQLRCFTTLYYRIQ